MTILNKDSIKYLMYIISQGKELPYLPREIREIIWDKYYSPLTLQCNICQKVIVNFNITVLESLTSEITFGNNSMTTCWPCKYAEDIMF